MSVIKKLILLAVVLFVSLLGYIQIGGNKTFDAPFPNIQASTDADIIAHGRYLVYGPAHCAPCHVPMDKILDVDNGLEMPLIGGMVLDIPPATLYAPNLTPDPETGIGNISDAAIARSIRYGVSHDGRYMMPVMAYERMNDDDLRAIISYLRSQPPVRNDVKPPTFKFLGKALLAFGFLKPKAPSAPITDKIEKAVSIEYGEYLSSGVANCLGCHTELDLMSGQFTKPPYSGGFYFEADAFSKGRSYIAPNITPDAKTGIMAHWTQDHFVHRFKTGRVHEGSPMPWGAFSRMDSVDVAAIYTFLQSLEGVEHKIDQIVFEPGEKPK